MRQRTVGLITLLLVLLVAAACDSSPSPEIVVSTSRDGGIRSFDYTVWVDCTVRNNGEEGTVTVIGELISGDEFWKKRESFFLSKGEERLVTLAFPEATLLDEGLGSYEYQCSAE